MFGLYLDDIYGLVIWIAVKGTETGQTATLGVYQVACQELLNFPSTGHSDCDSSERTVGSALKLGNKVNAATRPRI